MIANNLSDNVWNAIYDAITRSQSRREITFGKVVKRDAKKKLVWLEEFGEVAIPLVHFDYSFEHYDTVPEGVSVPGNPTNTRAEWRGDKTQKNDAYHAKIIVPYVGQMICVLNPGGTRRFPMCVGVIKSTDYWQGE